MKRRALILGTLACVSWSTVFVFGRQTISQHATDPVVLGFYRFGITGVVLLAGALALRRGRDLLALLREPGRVLFLGLTGGFAMGFFTFLALKHTHSIIVQLIMNSNPVLIVPLSLLVGERVGVGKACGVVLGVVGCILVLGGVSQGQLHENPHHVLGGVLAALSGLAWAAYTVFGRSVVQRHGGLVTTTLSMLIGGAAFLAACLAMGKGLAISWPGALTGVYLAIVPTVFGFTAWYVALKDLPANVLGPLQFIVPIGGVALAIVLLREELTPLMLLGGVLALGGVYLSTRRERDRRRA
ncbi:MAG: DMT family transporter [Planctomycetes bacterium]|nr:DMT family transporter [Planctomycetota bacterium]